MKLAVCHECGKRYDYEEDPFCPHCGSFNQPKQNEENDQTRHPIHRDGLNEKGHAGSFLHEEFHKEARERRGSHLHQGIRFDQRSKARSSLPAGDGSHAWAGRDAGTSKKKQPSKSILSWICRIIGVMILLDILASCVLSSF